MVMEASPSAQCVGREFVRQYYTLLHDRPDHLHRFYNQTSQFVHGGLDTVNGDVVPVIGQKQIHQRIQELKFEDCHAKISQVDSQTTLGNGVVVQVSGELSNRGQPMRRFTQTFVLAAQSPKKYYVHNDIFRYQDMLSYGEEEADPDSNRSEEHVGDSSRNNSQDLMNENPSIQQGYYGTAVVNGGNHHDEVQIAQQAPPNMPQIIQPQIYPNIEFHPMQSQQLQAAAVPGPNNQGPINQSISSVLGNVEPSQIDFVQSANTDSEENDVIADEIKTEETNVESKEQQVEEYPSLDNNDKETAITNEPPSYANRLKSGTVSSGTNIVTNLVSSKTSSSPPLLTSKTQENYGTARGQPIRGGPIRGGQTIRGMSRTNDRPMGQPRPSVVISEENYEDKKRSSQNLYSYPDNQQLFLGNLPLNATEDDLKEIFGKFGNIVELRIMNKPNLKGPNGQKVPNYGFIAFEDANTVQAILNNKPYYFPGETGIKLNVEEKKTKSKSISENNGRNNTGGEPRSRLGPPTRGGNRGFIPSRGMYSGRGGGGPLRPSGNGNGFSRNTSQR